MPEVDELFFSNNVLKYTLAAIISHTNGLLGITDEEKSQIVDITLRALPLFLREEYSNIFQQAVIDMVLNAEKVDNVDFILQNLKKELD